jgi:hypothetical protein
MVGNTYVPLFPIFIIVFTGTKRPAIYSPTLLVTGFQILIWHEHMDCEFILLWMHGGRAQRSSDVNSDAFALNVGHEDWQRARVADAYAAALQLQTEFKLFLSFDMT